MPLFGINDDQNQDDTTVDTLGEVTLQSFSASPSSIGPFGFSILNWSVTGPTGVSVKLNGTTVSKTGHSVVTPAITSSYRLSAHFRQASRPLGTVQVTVDRASCETWEINNPRAAIEAPIRAFVNNNTDGLYFSAFFPLLVMFSTGRIRIHLGLKKELDYFPNPSISIDVSFGLAVQNGVLEAVAVETSVNVSVPWYAWLIPTAPFPLALALAMAKDNAQKDARDLVQSVVAILNAAALTPQGKRLSTVRVDNGNNGAGVVELTACSQDLLIRFAELSSSVILT